MNWPNASLRVDTRRRWHLARAGGGNGTGAYVQTLAQRDVRDLARIRALAVLPGLLEFAAE